MLLLLIANTFNIAADVAAMGEVAELVTGFNRHLATAIFVGITWCCRFSCHTIVMYTS